MGWLHEGCRDTGPSWQERAEAAEAELSKADRNDHNALKITLVGRLAAAAIEESKTRRVA